MMTTSMQTIMIGKTLARAALALTDSSTLAPTSILYPSGKFVDDRLNSLGDLSTHLRWLQRVIEFTLNGNRWQTIAPLENRVLFADFNASNLTKRDEPSVAVS